MTDALAVHPTTQYALDVIQGRRVVGRMERLACQRHIDDLEKSARVERGELSAEAWPWVFDETRADAIFTWFSWCHHVKGDGCAGLPIELLPFQQFDKGCLFGWVHRESRKRRFQKSYDQRGRKNAKSTEMSGIALYLMVGDKEESPEVYCGAVDREQARIVWKDAKVMGEKSPNIAKRLKILANTITHRTRGGELKALSKETKNKDGLNPSGAIIDEYHAHDTSEIYDLLWSAWGQRSQALMAIITTAGFETNENPCYEEYKYCKKILTGGVTNERYFVMIRELDEGDDEHDPKNWIKANPLRAATPEGLAKLQEQHDEAFGSMIPEKIRNFRVKNLNIWVNETESSYIGEHLAKWDDLAVSPEEFRKLTHGLACIVGADLSKKIDLTADVFMFELPDGRTAVTSHGFIPEEAVAKHEKTDDVPYRMWAEAGWVTITPGAVTDYRSVKTHIQDQELENKWSVQEFCYDPYNATQFATEMADDGYVCVEIRQGYQTLSEPTKDFRELVMQEKMVHDGSPLFKWSLGNAVVQQDSNENIRISKKNASDTKRVDPLAAAINAKVRLGALDDAPKDNSDKVLDPNWSM